jgi:hypothetical protein
MHVEIGASLVMTEVLLSEWRNQVAGVMKRAVIIAMSATVLRLHLGRGIVTVEMFAVAPRAVNEEQTFVNDATPEDGDTLVCYS